MKNFYIFLDFDGTMSDIEFIKKLYYSGIKKNNTKIFKPESIEALNYLIDYLSQKYSVNLVISSVWRRDMNETIYYLNKNNIKLDKIKKIDKTGHYYDENNVNHRDQEIKQYLKEHNETKNYVAIDDEAGMFDLPIENKIETNIKNGALNMHMIKKWINNFKNLDDEFLK